MLRVQHKDARGDLADDTDDFVNVRRSAVALAAIIAVATLLRIVLLNRSLWLDEGIAVANAWAGGLPLNSWTAWLRELWRSEFNMVFYFALLRFWIRVASSEAWLRLLSLIPAVATIPLVYLLGKKLGSRSVALIAALLLAVHGAHINYSQEVRGYTLVVLLCTAATYFFLNGIETRARRWWVLYWLMCSLAVYTHLFGALIVAAHWVSLRWLPRRRVPWLQLVTASVCIVLTSGAAIAFALTNKAQQVEWISRLSIGQVVNVISELAGSPTALPVYLFLWFVAIKSVTHSRERTDSVESWHFPFIVSWLFVPLALAILISLKRPMLVPRYLLLSVPAATLLAAQGAMALTPHRRRIAVWAAVGLSVAFVLFRFTRPREDWRGASQYVLAHAKPSDVVVVVPTWSQPLFDYYCGRWHGQKPKELVASTFDVSTDPLASRLWIIRYQREYALQMPEVQALDRAAAGNYQLSDTRDFRLVQARLYTRAEDRQRR